MITLKVLGGILGWILIILGGIYLVRKTRGGAEMLNSIKNFGTQVKNSFFEGYAEAVN
ncbi:MAG: hypothetical protein HQK53_02600 [Oligoflexia bacterium]|nr:hypothetical protein [Oligoflexia bacterium]